MTEHSTLDDSERELLAATVHDMMLGTPEETDALFRSARPSTDEALFLRAFARKVAQPGEFAVYDPSDLLKQQTKALTAAGVRAAGRLARRDRGRKPPAVRRPAEMVAELVAAADDPYVLFAENAGGWVWGPCGPPYRPADAAGETHPYRAHAELWGADLGETMLALTQEGNTQAQQTLERLPGRCDRAARMTARAARLTAGYDNTAGAGSGAADAGWAAAAALRAAADENLTLAEDMRPAVVWFEHESFEEIGWHTLVGLSRLRALRERWMAQPSEGDAVEFRRWSADAPGGAVGWWAAVAAASGVEACRAVWGEAHAAGALLGRARHLTGG